MTTTTDPITAALTRSPRPYLPQLDYAADELADIRARLRARLPQVLPGWNAALAQENADPSARNGDAGLAILDALAVMIATLNLYADQRANESYVRTASLPRSNIIRIEATSSSSVTFTRAWRSRRHRPKV